MHPALEQLRDRKVVQWAVAYLAVAWVTIQLVDVLGDQFAWPLAIQQGITWVLVIGFAVTILTAFLHGIGRDEGPHAPSEGHVPNESRLPTNSHGQADLLGEGRAALKRGAWGNAVEALRVVDAAGHLDGAEDLEGLAEAAWWTGDLDGATSARERAVAAYLEQGNPERAAFLAVQNAEDFSYQRADSVASGWLARAERLLVGEAESVAHGHLQRLRSMKAMKHGDLDTALKLAKEVHDIGERHRDLDLQALSLQDQGRILIALGQVEAGLLLVDEAMASAVSGELSLHTTGRVYCNMMETCDKLSDFERASQWNDVGTKWCQDHTESIFPGICRVYRAKILGLRGAWVEAQAEALKASEELKPWLPVAGEAWYQIGELRLRLGELDAAESAFHQAHELGREPFPGIAELRWSQGRPDEARSLIDSALANPALDAPSRARLLPTKMTVAIAENDLPAAQKALDELSHIADQYPSPALSATLAEQRAEVAFHSNRIDDAIRSARAAVKEWAELGFPFETARARLTLARSFLATGDSAPAELELRVARSAFERLGARPAIEETLSLLPE